MEVAKFKDGDDMDIADTVDLFRKMPKYQELTI